MKHQVLDLFSGIGGFSLGLERTGGFETAAFCEVDKKAQLVLKKHWPNVPIYDDVQELNAERLREDGINPTVICGGFPCQDISIAGKGEGIEGKQSGLWSEYARLIGEIRPKYAIVENVSALLVRGIDRVLGDLAEIGFDAEWHCIPASAIGAPHRRDRVWIIAYCHTDSEGKSTSTQHDEEESRLQEYVADPQGLNSRQGGSGKSQIPQSGCLCEDVSKPRNTNRGTEYVADSMLQHKTQRGECPNAESEGGSGRVDQGGGQGDAERERPVRGTGSGSAENVADSDVQRSQGRTFDRPGTEASQRIFTRGSVARGIGEKWKHWAIEPNLGRVAHGVPKRVDRLKQLGNAVVPQIPEMIGNAILEFERNASTRGE